MARTAPPAPAWHTTALVATIVAVAVLGSALTASHPASPAPVPPGSRFVSVYVPTLLVQWGLVFYVCRIGRTRNVLRELIGRTWSEPGRAVPDIALAVGTASLIIAVNAAYTHLLGRAGSANAFLPQTPFERAVWVLVAISVAFCEEVVYRGYLMSALSRQSTQPHSVTPGVIGVVAQGALFGLAHLEQGVLAATPIAFFGVLLGALSRFRGSLVPGILCHAIVDLVSGLAGHG